MNRAQGLVVLDRMAMVPCLGRMAPLVERLARKARYREAVRVELLSLCKWLGMASRSLGGGDPGQAALHDLMRARECLDRALVALGGFHAV